MTIENLKENKELESWMNDDSNEPDVYIDSRIEDIRLAKAYIIQWSNLEMQLADLRVGKQIAKKVGDDQLEQRIFEQAKLLFARHKIVIESLKEILPKIKGIRFLSDADFVQLPTWMLKLINIDTDDLKSKMAITK